MLLYCYFFVLYIVQGVLQHLNSLIILVLQVLLFIEHLVESTIHTVLGYRRLALLPHQTYCTLPDNGLLQPTYTNSAATSGPRAVLTSMISFLIEESTRP